MVVSQPYSGVRGGIPINPLLPPKDLFEVTQVTSVVVVVGVLEPRLPDARLAVAVWDLLAAGAFEMKMATEVQNISVYSLILSPL